jgi:hypothetical protein
MPTQLTIELLDHRRQGVDERQAVGDDLRRHRGNSSSASQPRPGPVQ